MFIQESLSKRRTVLLIPFLTTLILVISACQSLQPQQATIPEIDISASEFTFENPAEIEAGLNYIKMDNIGEAFHHVQLLRINDDVTVDEFQAALPHGDEALLPLVTLHGGVGMLPNGGSGRVLMDLKEGRYLLADFIPGSDGVPNIAKGMITPMQVVSGGSSGASQAPSADAEVVLKDFNMVLPENIKSGRQIWKINNEGPQPHEIILLKLIDNMTMEDVQDYAESMDGLPPFEAIGGMQGLSTGESGYLELDLSPGRYIATCDIPDPSSGNAHSELGMLMQFDVE